MRRSALLVAGTLILATMSPVPRPGSAANADPLPTDRPNIVLLVSDDQQMATFTRALMPSVFSKLVDQGPDSIGSTSTHRSAVRRDPRS